MSKQIAKNTIILYFRMLFIAFISFYSVRVLLDVLGIEDYGIYNVIAGIVSLSSFIPATLASATQRFFSFAIGEKNQNKLDKIFSTNLVIYVIITIIAIFILEVFGLLFIEKYITLPSERLEIAITLYHLSVFAFGFTILSSPFIAIIISHEDMNLYAYISIIDAFLKLIVVISLTYFSYDKLELYGWMLFCVSLVTMFLYIIISYMKYIECQFKVFYFDKKLLKELINFTSWTMFGSISTVIRTHGVTILLNQVFNPTIVAARAIAVQIVSFTNIFSQNFNTALYPPIVKYYASNNKKEMFSLIYIGSKLTFFLMWVLVLPIMFKMDFLLNIWLNKFPIDTVLFSRLALIESLIIAISLPLTTAARAPGNMKIYELSLGSIQLLILPVSWLFLELGFAAYYVFIIAIFFNFIMFFIRLFIVNWLIGLPILSFFKKVLVPVLIVCIVSTFSLYFINESFQGNYMFNFLFMIISLFINLIIIYLFGLDKIMKSKIYEIVNKKIRKLS